MDPDWLDTLVAHRRAGRPVAVADLAYANGGDPWFVHALGERLGLRELAAYAGWNTAGNTLGSALAQALLAHGRLDDPAHRHNLALRLAEDVLWQAELRQVVRLGGLALPPSALAEHVQRLFVPQANAWLAPWGLGWRVQRTYLPWDRTFEIGLELEPAP